MDHMKPGKTGLARLLDATVYSSRGLKATFVNEAAFRPWEGHRADNQNPDGLAGPPDPESDLPLLPEPYTKDEVLAYWGFCDGMVAGAVDAMDVLALESGFHWYPIGKLEHQIVNVRHIQHGAAQLADRLRAAAGLGIEWAGSRA